MIFSLNNLFFHSLNSEKKKMTKTRSNSTNTSTSTTGSSSSSSNSKDNQNNAAPLDKSQNELETSLEKHITILEEYQNVFEQKMSNAEGWLDGSEEKMAEVTDLIHKQFTILTEALDKKKDDIIGRLKKNEVDCMYNTQGVLDEVHNFVEGMKALLRMEEYTTELVDVTEEVLSAKNKVNNKTLVGGAKRGLDEINTLQELPTKRVLGSGPTGFRVDKVYSVFASLCWDITDKFDEYIISMREEGDKWSDENSLIHIGNNSDHCIVYPLKPTTTYEFCVMGRTEEMETKWSGPVTLKTEARVVIPKIDAIVRDLLENTNDIDKCIRLLEGITALLKISKTPTTLSIQKSYTLDYR